LFTYKAERLGYAILNLDTGDGSVIVRYREWCTQNKFVLGTGLSANETGSLEFKCLEKVAPIIVLQPETQHSGNTIELLQAEFDESRICYSSKKLLWVERDLANVPETSPDSETAVLITSEDFAKSPHSCVIGCPEQFGLPAHSGAAPHPALSDSHGGGGFSFGTGHDSEATRNLPAPHRMVSPQQPSPVLRTSSPAPASEEPRSRRRGLSCFTRKAKIAQRFIAGSWRVGRSRPRLCLERPGNQADGAIRVFLTTVQVLRSLIQALSDSVRREPAD